MVSLAGIEAGWAEPGAKELGRIEGSEGGWLSAGGGSGVEARARDEGRVEKSHRTKSQLAPLLL